MQSTLIWGENVIGSPLYMLDRSYNRGIPLLKGSPVPLGTPKIEEVHQLMLTHLGDARLHPLDYGGLHVQRILPQDIWC